MTGWISNSETISARYARLGTATSGFDYLRLFLAVCVVLQHSLNVTDQANAEYLWFAWPRSFFGVVLPAFFALSGFLVTSSLLKRPTIAAFIAMRSIRLLPALAVETLLSAIVLGSLLTELPLSDYFSSGQFWSYFLNIIGNIQYVLPGVFTHNEYPDIVNVSLVTIPFELECYIALTFFYLIGFVTNRNRLLMTLAALVVLGTILMFVRYQSAYEVSPPSGRSLVIAFLAGVAIQLFADRVRLNLWLALASLVVGALILRRVEFTFVAVIPLAYATIYFGMLNPPRSKIVLSGDYSYGFYLFAFPIQQTHYLLFPNGRWWLYNFLFTLVFGFAYAALSWWCVERPILSRKRQVCDAANRLYGWLLRLPKWLQSAAFAQKSPK
jgi:peptidoglycan/LPS O-acetylase OafA/YrhL